MSFQSSKIRRFIMGLKDTDLAKFRPDRTVLIELSRWPVFGAIVALISIGLMAVAAEEFFLWFYAAWFVTVVVITGLSGIFFALLANGYNRLEKRGSRHSQ